jgi:hypothetical protein
MFRSQTIPFPSSDSIVTSTNHVGAAKPVAEILSRGKHPKTTATLSSSGSNHGFELLGDPGETVVRRDLGLSSALWYGAIVPWRPLRLWPDWMLPQWLLPR